METTAIKMRVCRKCGVQRPENSANFPSNGKAGESSLRYCCKPCWAAYQKARPREKKPGMCCFCGAPATKKARACRACHGRLRVGPAHPSWRGGKYKMQGYVYRKIAGGGVKGEHRDVMESVLGRPLRADENVHHKNGIRDDNRPENLELWVKPQPCGQRVEDLVRFAREILERYGP